MSRLRPYRSAVFVSGHLDLTAEEFAAHYVPVLRDWIGVGARFIVGDARGCDAMAQRWIWDHGATAVVYHMFDTPRHNPGFPTRGGFSTDDARDAAMTKASDDDVAWVRPGRETSGTARNLARRAKSMP